jgi:hypothetical protein
MFAAIGPLLKGTPAQAGIECGGRCGEEVEPGIAEAPCRIFDDADQCRGNALAPMLGRHVHAGKPRISWIAFQIVEDEGSCARDGVGSIKGDERNRHSVDIELAPDPNPALLECLIWIEMPPLGEAPSCDLVDELGTFDEGDDLQRYSAALRFTAAERPRSVAIS